ncbi:NosD domain-containing protein [Bacteroides caccae]|uniref:NosD domain-containing protein n=1 Tax=Bacteroides caccae TaxID=47678 RepID=UPI00216B5645|nr:NosD domain-containing protein [Bacteroides caccae]
MIGGENIVVKNCQLGAQPTGITCKVQEVNKLSFINNQVYPDGRENLVLDACNNCVIEGNNFKSYYNGILVLNGNDNTVNKNIFWLTGAVQNQLLDHGDDFGIINVKGNNNMVTSNSLSCEWAYAGAVTVNAVQGTGNVFKNCFVDNLESYRVFLVNAQTEVSNCVSSDKVSIVE